ncbi:hypothetical protein IJG04_00450 [Candidatus Saccharibacteria bacterium]|nr:hypothetical protein [Candidatus Saccharibacteria bacterium]
MTDYYKVLNIDREKHLDEIDAELIRLESIWKRREITSPEKSAIMLSYIFQARQVFSSDATRSKYDKELEASRQEFSSDDFNSKREQSLKKWIDQANSYYSKQQYDLAKVAIEKALSITTMESDDDSLFVLAAEIFCANNNYDVAIEYINQAIVSAPNISKYYLIKSRLYYAKGFEDVAINLCHEAEKIAIENGDNKGRAQIYGFMAGIYLSHQHGEEYIVLAEKYANMANQCGGDPSGNADRVIQFIQEDRKRKKDEAEKAERIRRQKEEDAERTRKYEKYFNAVKLLNNEAADNEQLFDAIRLLESLGDWNDSPYKLELLKQKIYDNVLTALEKNCCVGSDKIVMIEEAIYQLELLNGWKDSAAKIASLKREVEILKKKEEEENSKRTFLAEKRQRMLKIALRVFLIVLVISAITAGVVWRITYLNNHKAGDNLYWSVQGSRLTIKGKGDMFNYDNRPPWYNTKAEIKTIVIKNGVTGIGSRAFNGTFDSIEIPSTVTHIEKLAFGSVQATHQSDVFYHGTKEQWIEITKNITPARLEHFIVHYK